MGDPLSICSDPQRAANEMFRICKPGGVVIATADNKLAALDHFVERGNLDALEEFVRTGETNWLTADERERFELTTFTPATLRRLFERAGFEVISRRRQNDRPGAAEQAPVDVPGRGRAAASAGGGAVDRPGGRAGRGTFRSSPVDFALTAGPGYFRAEMPK